MGNCYSNPADQRHDRQQSAIPLSALPASSPSSAVDPRTYFIGSAQDTTTSVQQPLRVEAGQESPAAPTSRPTAPRTSSGTFSLFIRRNSEQMPRPSLNALRTYATLPDPASSLPASVLLFANAQTLVIFDAFPKAKYHFLVLPRYPFPPQSDPDSKQSLVKLDHLDDLKTLLLRPPPEDRDEVIRAMVDTAREVEEMIRDEMVKTEGFEWKIDTGFHAIPSMKHVHLHVISEDRISPSMKTKKHHNSFRPDLGFFLDAMEVERWIQQDRQFMRERIDALMGLETLLDFPLTCFKCDEPFSTIPKLKIHLEKEFAEEKKSALERIRRTGRQERSSDEEDIF